MTSILNLLPQPQRLTPAGGTYTLPPAGLIALHVPRPADLLFTARRAQAVLQQYAGANWEIAGGDLPGELILSIDATALRPEGYRLTIDASGIRIAAHDAPGAFYGVATLVQLIQTHGRELPCLVIEDWPDFAARGVLLDISRDKVPTMETLYHLIDLLAGWKVNQFQLYTEHTFAYRNHRDVWEHASPLTAEEILALDAYCRDRYIDLVPNQNSFGHMDRWVKHPRYHHLAETEGEFMSIWGTVMPPFSFSPAVPAALDLIEELYAELLPNFTSRMFNVGCDETIDLGLGRSKALVEQKGKGRVYLDVLLEIYRRVQPYGHTMQFWGDIINQYPDLVPEIPRDTLALEWGYEDVHDFPGKTKLFAESGVPFYVCPGTSSWRTLGGRTDNCIGNIRNAVENGLKNGAAGVLNTDWGDVGHWQTLPISYLGFAYGAALSWAHATNTDLDLPAALDAFVFHTRRGGMGKLAYDLGNAYQVPGIIVSNSSLLFNLYHRPLAHLRESAPRWTDPAELSLINDDTRFGARLRESIAYIEGVMDPLDETDLTVPDAALIAREFRLAARMLIHGAQRGLFQLSGSTLRGQDLAADLDDIEAEYRQVWLARNRPGGLDDSATRLRQARRLYEA